MLRLFRGGDYFQVIRSFNDSILFSFKYGAPMYLQLVENLFVSLGINLCLSLSSISPLSNIIPAL